MEVWSDRGSTCKFRNARSAFRNLHVDPLSLHTSMRNKQVEFNLYIYTLTALSKLYRFGYEISVFLIQNTRSLLYGRHYSSLHRLMSLHRKLNVKFFLMFIVAENTGSVNITIPKADVYQIIQSNWFCVHIIDATLKGCIKIKSMDLANMQREVTFAQHI